MRKYFLTIITIALWTSTALCGGVDSLKKYVAIGDGFTAGYQDHALYRAAQIYSFPNLIAQQMKNAGANLGTFEQPLYSDPGNPDPITGKAARYEIISSYPNLIVGSRGLAPGSPVNSTLARPYDNLGIPAASLFDFMDTTDIVQRSIVRMNPFFQLVLRNNVLGKSIFQQLKALNPDVITFWLGTLDLLSYATSGGVSPTAPISDSLFTTLYSHAIDTLRKTMPNAKIIIANIPDIKAIPYFTTLGSVINKNLPPNEYIRYQKHGNRGVAFDSTLLTENNAPLITMSANSYTAYIGKPSGKVYKDYGIPIPTGIDTTKPFGMHPQNPILDMFILDSAEQKTVTQSVTISNQSISTIANSNNCALVDINYLFNKIQNNGYVIGGNTIRAEYITGGLFSLDAFQPSIRGYGIIANEFIKTMNTKYGYQLLPIDIWSLPGIPGLTNVVKENTSQPDNFQLEQNYPNPFNPVTKITISLSSSYYLTLEVIDVIGRKVATLFNGELPSGKHEIIFDGSSLSSGIYFARLQSGSIVQVKKLVLQK